LEFEFKKAAGKIEEREEKTTGQEGKKRAESQRS
jgi:hypothetical protein